MMGVAEDKYKKDLNTASGMWGLWNYDTYKHIDDYDKLKVIILCRFIYLKTVAVHLQSE